MKHSSDEKEFKRVRVGSKTKNNSCKIKLLDSKK